MSSFVDIVVHQSDTSSTAPTISINAAGKFVRIIVREGDENGEPKDRVIYTGEHFDEDDWKALVQARTGLHQGDCRCSYCLELAGKGGR